VRRRHCLSHRSVRLSCAPCNASRPRASRRGHPARPWRRAAFSYAMRVLPPPSPFSLSLHLSLRPSLTAGNWPRPQVQLQERQNLRKCNANKLITETFCEARIPGTRVLEMKNVSNSKSEMCLVNKRRVIPQKTIFTWIPKVSLSVFPSRESRESSALQNTNTVSYLCS
jgi:hypothetical protein